MKRNLAIGVLLAVVVELAAAAATWSQWQVVEQRVGTLLGLLSRPEKPTVSEAVPLAKEVLVAGVVCIGAAVAGLVLIWLAVRWMSRRTGPGGTQRGSRAWRAVVWISVALLVLAVSGAIAFVGSPATVVEARGSQFTIVNPADWRMVLWFTLTGVGVAVATARRRLAPGPDLSEGDCEVAGPHGRIQVDPRLIRWVLWGAVGAAAVLTAVFIVEAALARPIADDFRFQALVRDWDVGDYLSRHLTEETGRYSQAMIVWLAFKVFGSAAIQVFPILCLVGLACAAALSLRAFHPAFREGSAGPAWVVGWLFAAVAVQSAPSVVDSYLWLTSAAVYVPGVVALALAAAAARSAVHAPGIWRSVGMSVLAAALVFVGQGFFEATALIGFAGSLLFAAALLVRGSRRWPVGVVVFLAGVTGLMVLLGAQSSTGRQDAVGGTSALLGVLGSVYGQIQLWQATPPSAWLLVAAVAVVVGVLSASRAAVVRGDVIAVVGAFLAVVVPAVCCAAAFFGLGWAPWRTYTASSLGLIAGSMLVLGHVVGVGIGRWQAQQQNEGPDGGGPAEPAAVPVAQRVAGVAAVVLAIGGIASALPDAVQLIQAESARARLVATRDASVQEQLKDGAKAIEVTPAPLLVYPTDARDFEYEKAQSKDWFELGYRTWFGIPFETPFVFDPQPPAGYCSDDPDVVVGREVLQCGAGMD